MSGKEDPLLLYFGDLQKKKGAQGVIEIENPNLVKIKNLKVKDVDVSTPSVNTSSVHGCSHFFLQFFCWVGVRNCCKVSRPPLVDQHYSSNPGINELTSAL
jgi:hypothetical protein